MRAKSFCCAIFALSAVFAGPVSDDLQGVTSRMDEASSKFQAMRSKVHYATYLKVIEDTSEETATVIMKRVRPNEIAGRINFNPPNERTVVFERRQAQVYQPKAKTVQIYDLGKHGEQLDRFLMIGFGTSGTELARDYSMKVVGKDTVDGKSTTRLEMIPKTDDIKNVVSKLELWIPDPPAQPYPIQEKIYQQSGDYRLVNYSNLEINPSIPASVLELKLPPGVKREYPQK